MRHRRGFTTTELVVAVAIIGLLMSIAVPVGLNQINSSRIAAADTTLRSMEREAARIAAGRAPAAAAAIAAETAGAGAPEGAVVAALEPNGVLPARFIWLDINRGVCRLLLLPTTGDGETVTCSTEEATAGQIVDDELDRLTEDGIDLTDPNRWLLQPLGTPGGLGGTFDSPTGRVNLDWIGATGADPQTRYHIWQRPIGVDEDPAQAQAPWRRVATVATPTWTSPRLPADRHLQFAVSASNDAYDTGRSEPLLIDVGTLTPAPPTALAGRAGDGTATLTWTLAPGDRRELRLLRTEPACDDVSTCTVLANRQIAAGSRQFVDADVDAGSWRYWIAAVDNGGFADPVASTVVTVGDGRPTPPRNVTVHGQLLTWEPPSNIDEFVILRDGYAVATVDGTTTTLTLDDQLRAGAPVDSWQWKVVAVRGDKWSASAGPALHR